MPARDLSELDVSHRVRHSLLRGISVSQTPAPYNASNGLFIPQPPWPMTWMYIIVAELDELLRRRISRRLVTLAKWN
jgi:hypothetical protein